MDWPPVYITELSESESGDSKCVAYPTQIIYWIKGVVDGTFLGLLA